MRQICLIFWTCWILFYGLSAEKLPAQERKGSSANRLTYLDEYCDPYYPGLNSAKLTTPQWVGEEGVDAVITLGIDDMRDPGKYESYLRPILDRLKKIDGRAAVSIMTCSVDPKHKQLQTWLEEGVSIECHTIDHPCPCLQQGNFARAKDTYDRCVDLMNQIPGNAPVAFRFPCMDSLNTPSPRAFAEIVNRKTANGNFLQISTSVTCLLTPKDPAIGKHFYSGKEFQPDRFSKYVPFPSFVNQIENYPYPYLIGNQCWEFPCTIPDDWQGQNIQRPHNPKTVDDLKAAIDATVTKKGVANIIFHPHNWIRAEQIVEVIDHVEKTYGKRVKFLTFKECLDRINRSMLKGVAVRDPQSGENSGNRLLDLNGDGFQDVLIGNQKIKVGRIWNPESKKWIDFEHKLQLDQTRFGIHDGKVVAIHSTQPGQFKWLTFDPNKNEFRVSGTIEFNQQTTVDHLRIRDLDLDGNAELIVAALREKAIWQPELKKQDSKRPGFEFKKTGEFSFAIADAEGKDNGLRFVDLNEDSYADILISNDTQSAIELYQPKSKSFHKIKPGTEIPRIVSGGRNNGAWFAKGHLWIQNEHTQRLPDGVDRRSFQKLLANTEPAPKSPEASLRSIDVGAGFKVELMAAEPLVMDPIAMEWGLDGKLWVVEMADYPLGLDDRGKPGGRVRYLEDTNGDGKYDRSTLFIDQIPFPTGVLPTNLDPDKPSCLISAAPYIVNAKQKSSWNELIADKRNILLSGFGEGNQQHRFNGFSPGLDNWIYLANGDSGGTIKDESGNNLNIRGQDLRIRTGSPVRIEAQTGQTQFGRHCNSWGNWFGCSNPIPLRQYVLPDHYLKRNPHYRYPAARMDIATAGNTQVFPRAQVLSHWSGYRPPAPGQPHRFTSACSTDFYRGKLFGEEFANNSFTCEPVHNLIHRRINTRNGILFRSVRPASESNREFLASSDSWSRPTTVKTGPDGAIWFADMYRLVIEHPEWIDDQREKELFLRAGHDRGRIYRVVPIEKSPRPLPVFNVNGPLTRKSVYSIELTDHLLKMMEVENRWYLETAQRFMVQLGQRAADPTIADKLARLTGSAKPLVRLHAFCTLDGRNELTEDQLIRAISDQHPEIRRHAARISERFLARGDQSDLLSELSELANDSDPAIRMQLAFSLGYSQQPAAAKILAQLGNQNQDEPYIMAAVMSSLNHLNLAQVIQSAESIPADAKFLMPLLEQSIRLGKPELAQSTLIRILSSKDPSRIPTRQLELVVQVFQGIPASNWKGVDGLPEQAERFTHSVSQSLKVTDSVRRKTAAIQIVSRSPWIKITEKINWLTGKIKPQSDLQIQKLAVTELARINHSDVVRFFIQRWREVTPEIQSSFLEAILQRTEWSLELLNSIARKKTRIEDFSTNQRNRFLAHSNTKVHETARKVFPATTQPDRVGIVQNYLNELSQTQRKPDLNTGQKVFDKNCSKCHRLNGLGNNVGPDLLAIKDFSTNALVRALVQPNQAVEDKYRTYVVALDDGRELTGLIQSESSTQIKLANQEGKTIDLFRSQVERIKSTGRSLMPEGLDKEIDISAMQDLVHFLQTSISTAKPVGQRKKFMGNQPSLVQPDSNGVLSLTAKTCEIYGPKIVYEAKYQNLGFWGHQDDLARWQFQLPEAGTYDVFLNFACPGNTAGNSYAMQVSSQTLKGKITATESWDHYARRKIGTVKLNAGQGTVRFSSDGKLRGFLLDLKSIELEPVKN